MANKELNLWIERFSRDIGYKSSVIVFGNTVDIMLNPKNSGKYDSVINTLISYVRDKGFKQVVKWDRVEGIDYSISDEITEITNPTSEENGADEYDLGDFNVDNGANKGGKCYKSPDEFFPYMLNVIKNSHNKTAFVLDYSDYIFGNANSLSEKERDYLKRMSLALRTCSCSSSSLRKEAR